MFTSHLLKKATVTLRCLSSLSLAIDVTDATLGASGLWLGTRTGAGGTATLTESFFWPRPMAPWTTRKLRCGSHVQNITKHENIVAVMNCLLVSAQF